MGDQRGERGHHNAHWVKVGHGEEARHTPGHELLRGRGGVGAGAQQRAEEAVVVEKGRRLGADLKAVDQVALHA